MYLIYNVKRKCKIFEIYLGLLEFLIRFLLNMLISSRP